MDSNILLTVEQAAHRLSVGRTVMYQLIRSGQIETVKIGRLRRIPTDALRRYVNSLGQTATPYSRDRGNARPTSSHSGEIAGVRNSQRGQY